MPTDLIASAYIHLALTRVLRGDLTRAEAELAQAARRVEQNYCTGRGPRLGHQRGQQLGR
jgi:hypothetical protein